VLSLKERLELLEGDLTASPIRISSYRDLPFAILRYDPHQEWQLRRELTLLEARLQALGKRTARLSFGRLLWKGIEQCEGVEAIADLETVRGFVEAERQVATYLSDPDWAALPDLVIEHVEGLTPRPDVVFLVRAGAMAPAAYHMSKLLDELQGKTAIPIVLCYPGSLEPGSVAGLRFMDLPGREASGNYRVKIYG
jgi:hypothetical protein